jgi:zinc/manganese transport system ATP-binding protein
MSTESKIITSKNLVAGYPGNIVWRDASFAIDRGEFVAVIGPNGVGKTTLFRLLLGLQQPVSGTIKIFNAAPKRGNPQIGYVPQRHIFDGETNVESLELVRLGFSGKQWGLASFNRVKRWRHDGLFSHNDRRAAVDTLEAVGASDLAHRSLGVLSGGELQRIFLAEALVSDPSILLLDEPLSNLDMRREKELVQLISGVVRSRNVTALLIAHNINPLLPFLDKVVYIANGKVATGTPQEVLTSECLTALFGVHVEVLRDSRGNVAVVGIEDVHRDE